MTALVDLTIRSSAILLLGVLGCIMLRQQSAAVRHCVLATSLFAAAVVAPLSPLLPSWTIAVPPPIVQHVASAPRATVSTDLAVTVEGAAPTPHQPAHLSVVALLWAAGAAIGLGLLLASLVRLAWISRRARPVLDAEWIDAVHELRASYAIRRRVILLQSDAPDLLATFGAFRPRVILPAHAGDWSDDRLRAVLSHELAHVRRHDWAIQIGAELLRAIYWFNPLIWIACARLRRESEHACDDAVLARGMPARAYAGHLLDLARLCRRPSAAWVSVTPMARASTLERRITVMLNPDVNRAALSRRAFALTAAALACLAIPIAALRAAQTNPALLAGSVYDPTGAVLPEVRLSLEDAQQVNREATTDRNGRFEFPAVAPGKYVLKASLPGFRALQQEIELQTARDWDRAITLQVGDLRETIIVQSTRTSPSQPKAVEPVRIGGNIRPPRKLQDVRPVYPVSMREAGREAVVPMEATIGIDGTVSSVRVLTAQVHPDFAIAAIDAVRQWLFDPTMLNGKPVEVRMNVSVEFTLAQ